MDIEMIPIIGIIAGCGMIVAIVWLVTSSRQRRVQAQAEVQTRLIDKFSSAPELVAFLQSPAGQEFVGNAETAPKLHARDRIIGGVRKSIVFGMLGVGFLALCIPEGTRNEGFMIAGAILVALGVGNFVSTLVAMKLSREWGLMDGESNRDVTSSSVL